MSTVVESPADAPTSGTDLPAPCGVIEFRQYTLHPGRRDELIDLFERELVDTQETCGIRLLGEFRDLDDPDRFVWLRGFADLHSRAGALGAFYSGPAWRNHRGAANATMRDSDDVLLLRPAHAAVDGFDAAQFALVIALIWQLPLRVGADFSDLFQRRVGAELQAGGARVLATWVSEHASNSFPALPVREGENVFVCLTGFGATGTGEDIVDALATAAAVNIRDPAGTADPQVLRLVPVVRTSRSRAG